MLVIIMNYQLAYTLQHQQQRRRRRKSVAAGPLGRVPARVALRASWLRRTTPSEQQGNALFRVRHLCVAVLGLAAMPASFSVVTVVQFMPVFTVVASIMPSLF